LNANCGGRGRAHAVAVSIARWRWSWPCVWRAWGQTTTWPRSATASLHRQCGGGSRGAPLFVDIQPHTTAWTRTRSPAPSPAHACHLCVHQIGFSCDLPAILAIARSRGLPVIEDAACAIGSEIVSTATGSASASPRSAGLLLISSAQADHHGTADDHDVRLCAGRAPAFVAPARHVTNMDPQRVHHLPRWEAASKARRLPRDYPARLAMRAPRDVGELLRAGFNFA